MGVYSPLYELFRKIKMKNFLGLVLLLISTNLFADKWDDFKR